MAADDAPRAEPHTMEMSDDEGDPFAENFGFGGSASSKKRSARGGGEHKSTAPFASVPPTAPAFALPPQPSGGGRLQTQPDVAGNFDAALEWAAEEAAAKAARQAVARGSSTTDVTAAARRAALQAGVPADDAKRIAADAASKASVSFVCRPHSFLLLAQFAGVLRRAHFPNATASSESSPRSMNGRRMLSGPLSRAPPPLPP